MTLNCPSSRSLKLHLKYFENCDRYNDGLSGSEIRIRPWAIGFEPTSFQNLELGQLGVMQGQTQNA